MHYTLIHWHFLNMHNRIQILNTVPYRWFVIIILTFTFTRSGMETVRGRSNLFLIHLCFWTLVCGGLHGLVFKVLLTENGWQTDKSVNPGAH